MACNGIQKLEIDGIHFHGMMIIVMGFYNEMLIGYMAVWMNLIMTSRRYQWWHLMARIRGIIPTRFWSFCSQWVHRCRQREGGREGGREGERERERERESRREREGGKTHTHTCSIYTYTYIRHIYIYMWCATPIGCIETLAPPCQL